MRITGKTSIDLCEMEYKLAQLEDILEKYKIDTPQELDKDLDMCHRLVYKYGQVEDELGIDLLTLIKALQSRVLWFVDYEKTNFGTPFQINTCDCQFDFNDKFIHIVDEDNYDFKDYGKTWALEKKELE